MSLLHKDQDGYASFFQAITQAPGFANLEKLPTLICNI